MPLSSKIAEKIYLYSPFTFVDQAVVTNIQGKILYLSQTIFHPKGGGQLDDKGTIDNVNVIQVLQDETGDVSHHLESTGAFQIGQKVTLMINPEARLKNMTLHSAGHLLAGIVAKSYSIIPIKGHHYPGEAKMTFLCQDKLKLPSKENLTRDITALVNNAISEKTEIRVVNNDKGRTVQVNTYEPVGCGGTHLNNASQITDFCIRSVKFKGDELYVGYDATFNKEKL